jgi:hypothetical protein
MLQTFAIIKVVAPLAFTLVEVVSTLKIALAYVLEAP